MLRDSEFARRSESGIQIRPGAVRLRWDLTDLATADGHLARGSFAGSARALPEANQLKMLDEVFLGSNSVVAMADVVAYFAEAILSAARKHARGVDSQTLLADEGKQMLATVLMAAADSVAFGCGIEMLQPVQVELDCPTLQRRQFEEMDRQAAQRRAADQVDQLRRSAELFKQFEAVRAAAPELSPGQVLNRIGTTDQADVFRAMVLASAQKSARSRLWAVAGSSLIRIDGEESPRIELVGVPANLGPLRSVRGDGAGGLMLGCQAGVMRVDIESPNEAVEYRDPEVSSRLGFNAAVMLGDRIWAAHGEAGLICWMLDQPEKPIVSLRPRTSKIPGFAPRNLFRLDSDRVILSSGGQLAIGTKDGGINPIGQPTGADIVGIHVQPRRILTVQGDGQICSWSGEDFKLDCRQRRSGRIAAAAILPWMGDVRLLLATEEGPIVCVGPDDELLTQFTSAYPGLRIAAAAADAIAAVTADRQRLILWHPWDGRRPFSDLFVYGLARHRVADIAFV
jgi:hypothetical protein